MYRMIPRDGRHKTMVGINQFLSGIKNLMVRTRERWKVKMAQLFRILVGIREAIENPNLVK